MPYTVTTHTAKGDYALTLDSIDAVDQFVSTIRYRSDNQLVHVATDPIRFIYASQIEGVTVEGLTKEAVVEWEQAKREEQEARYRETVSQKAQYATAGGLVGGQYANDAACLPVGCSTLASVVR